METENKTKATCKRNSEGRFVSGKLSKLYGYKYQDGKIIFEINCSEGGAK